ncbi:hypothetical protein [Actinocrinis sp.]|uniref:hypothetical protein n=1 Tax=Actinocrinis sp. TaxID=1920516 RepID=UPI002D4A5275|nr:hypothetical protein [Actinocrinis sp.]HZP53869.1 hypothetical protein [Actinocrinis sp.]
MTEPGEPLDQGHTDTPMPAVGGLFEPLPSVRPQSSPNPSDDLILMAADVPARPRRRTGRKSAPPRPAAQQRTTPRPALPEHTAVYRLYDDKGVLLYVGQSNAPLERYVEHRDTKPWWPQVAEHSIEWRTSLEQALRTEKRAIRDEWPLHNIAHQPRGDGPFVIPSYTANKILSMVSRACLEVLGEKLPTERAAIVESVRDAFYPELGDDGDLVDPEITFAIECAPRREPLDLDASIAAVGQFRPPLANSKRDPNPVYQRAARKGAA